MSLLHVVQFLILSVVCVSGCFITNCPPGGKRSESEEKTHQCEQCGPPGLGGRCYGPQICCSPQFGCSIGTPITTACQKETHSPSLCHNQAISCDGSGETGPVNGQCAALGVCCTPETCTLDDDCVSDHLVAIANARKGHPVRHSPLLQHSEDGENAIPLAHGPIDSWFYRRLLHSKPKMLDSKIPSEMELAVMPQGPPFFPAGPPRLADYF